MNIFFLSAACISSMVRGKGERGGIFFPLFFLGSFLIRFLLVFFFEVLCVGPWLKAESEAFRLGWCRILLEGGRALIALSSSPFGFIF